MERAMLRNKKRGHEQSVSKVLSFFLLVRHELQFCQQGKKDAKHLSEHNLYTLSTIMMHMLFLGFAP
jgi:hypothetical protein